jgi:hypothetical protein
MHPCRTQTRVRTQTHTSESRGHDTKEKS